MHMIATTRRKELGAEGVAVRGRARQRRREKTGQGGLQGAAYAIYGMQGGEDSMARNVCGGNWQHEL